MRIVGRVILFIVGIVLVGYAVPVIVSNWQALTANGWDFEYMKSRTDLISSLVSQLANFSAGVTAIFAAIRGKATFKLFWVALVMIAGVVWFFYSSYKAGTLGDWKTILQATLGFALPITYFLATLMITFNSGKK